MFTLLLENQKFIQIKNNPREYLNKFPLAITQKSKKYPNFINEIDSVKCIVAKLNAENNNFTLFFNIYTNDELKNENIYYLLWKPVIDYDTKLAEEYNECINMGVLCKNMYGYYIGNLKDQNVLKIKVIDEEDKGENENENNMNNYLIFSDKYQNGYTKEIFSYGKELILIKLI